MLRVYHDSCSHFRPFQSQHQRISASRPVEVEGIKIARFFSSEKAELLLAVCTNARPEVSGRAQDGGCYHAASKISTILQGDVNLCRKVGFKFFFLDI